MINDYVIKLIDNLPDDIKNTKTPLVIDVVLEGGVFNGSYLAGAMYFLKEMENRKYIKIDRISGCSIGSIVGFLYFIDALEYIPKIYEIFNKEFRKSYKLTCLKKLKTYLSQFIPTNVCEKINNRLFITYNNIKRGKKPVKSTYKNVDDIIKTLISSCYIPYLIDGNILYKNKAMDGVIPFIFKKEPNKKILYLDLFGCDKMCNLLNIKNENNNYHRILSGLLDIHSFFIKKTNTPMCSFVDEWNIFNVFSYYVKYCFEKLFIYIILLIIFIKKKILYTFTDTIIYKIISKILHEIFIIIIKTYCL